MISLSNVFPKELILRKVSYDSSEKLIGEVSEKIAEFLDCGIRKENITEKILQREQLGSTAIGEGIAVPHCRLEGMSNVIGAIVLLSEGIEFNSPDGKPVDIFFFIISPIDKPAIHLETIKAIAEWARDKDKIAKLKKAHSVDDIHSLLVL